MNDSLHAAVRIGEEAQSDRCITDYLKSTIAKSVPVNADNTASSSGATASG